MGVATLLPALTVTHADWSAGLAQELPEFAREFLLGAVEESVPVQVALGERAPIEPK